MCRAITNKSHTCTYVNRSTLYRISLTHDGLIKEYGLNANTNNFLLSHVAYAYLPKIQSGTYTSCNCAKRLSARFGFGLPC